MFKLGIWDFVVILVLMILVGVAFHFIVKETVIVDGKQGEVKKGFFKAPTKAEV